MLNSLLIGFDHQIEPKEEVLIRKQIDFHYERKAITRRSFKANSDKRTTWTDHNQASENELDNS